MGVSKNRGTPKWMVYKGKTLLELMIWGYPYFWKHPIYSISPSPIPSFHKKDAIQPSLQLGDSKPFSYMTFTQLFSGGSRLGYYSAYGQRPLARTAALSGGAIDGFILGDSDSMSFLVQAGCLEAGGYLKICLHTRELRRSTSSGMICWKNLGSHRSFWKSNVVCRILMNLGSLDLPRCN